MTVATTLNRKTYAGNGATVAFPTTFEFENEEDLVVILKDNSTGVETTKALTTDYTVTGGSGSTGTVTMLVAPATGTTFTVYNDPDIIQDLDLVEGDVSPAESKEQAWDRLTFICQRLADRMDRAIRLSEGFQTTFDLTLPELLTADSTLVINSTADGFDLGPDITSISDAAANAIAAAASASAAAGSASAASTSASAAAVSAAAAAAAITAALAASPTITTPTISGPVISNYIDFTEVAVQAAPGAGKTRFWAQSDGFWLRHNGGVALRVGSGGGGGGSAIWKMFSNAPAEGDDGAGLDLLDFNSSDAQEIWTQLLVPSDYVAGTQVFLKGGKFASSVISGNVKFKATAYLVKTGTYVLGANGTGYDSTNAQVAVSGTTNKIVEIGDIDLSSSSGTINSVAIAAGDLILAKLIRDTTNETSAAAGDARLLRYAMVPKFSA